MHKSTKKTSRIHYSSANFFPAERVFSTSSSGCKWEQKVSNWRSRKLPSMIDKLGFGALMLREGTNKHLFKRINLCTRLFIWAFGHLCPFNLSFNLFYLLFCFRLSKSNVFVSGLKGTCVEVPFLFFELLL